MLVKLLDQEMLPSNEKLRTEILMGFSKWQVKFDDLVLKIIQTKDKTKIRTIKNKFIDDVEIPAWERIRKIIHSYFAREVKPIIGKISDLNNLLKERHQEIHFPTINESRKEAFKSFNKWNENFTKLIISIKESTHEKEINMVKKKFMVKIEVPTWDQVKNDMIRYYSKIFLELEAQIQEIIHHFNSLI